MGALALGNVFLTFGILLRILSIRFSLEFPFRKLWVIGGVVTYLLVSTLLAIFVQDPSMLLYDCILLTIIPLGLLFYLAHLVDHLARAMESANATRLFYVIILMALSVVLQEILAASQIYPPDKLLSSAWTIFHILCLGFAAVVGDVCYLGIEVDRLVRQESDSVFLRSQDEENRKLSDQIRHLDRQRGLTSMAVSLGHELSQPLTSILSNVEVLRRGMTSGRMDTEMVVEFLGRIKASAQRGTKIVTRVREFIRKTEPTLEHVNLEEVVGEVRELIGYQAKDRRITVSLAPVERPIFVVADKIQISQILFNLAKNSIEAINNSESGKIHVTILALNGRAIVRVRDSGPGFSKDILNKVGTAFFTTKKDGSGLGLSISRTIAEQFGATILLMNDEDGGALVEVNFPEFTSKS